ncbi:MAG: class SAM-dependent methyltransferase [Proteobacteria bacterium]|nr:class SAM-dependent methyltransferase [Pseudomonadota bacterium]
MDRETAEFYRTRAEEWAAAAPWEWNKWLDPFLDRLAPGAQILELGCGDGRDAARMIARGFAVELSDGVAEMAALASRRLGRDVPVMRFDELAAENAFDAAYTSASLLHVPLAALPGILSRIHRALVPGGLHYASYKGGTGGGRDEHGRFYSYLPLADLAAAYRHSAAWSELEFETHDGTSFGGAPTVWHAVIARK